MEKWLPHVFASISSTGAALRAFSAWTARQMVIRKKWCLKQIALS